MLDSGERLREARRDHWTIRAMKVYGGGFVEALADAALHADEQNLALIKKTWPRYWEQYAEMGAMLEQREKEL